MCQNHIFYIKFRRQRYFLFKVTIFAPKQLKTYLFGSDSDGGVRPFSGQSDRGQKQKGEASHDFDLMGTALN